MKNNEEVKQHIEDLGYDEVTIFEDPDYAPAFIGISHDDRAVYDYNKMVRFLMDRDKMSEDEAIWFIEYNTIRALDYMGDNAPIVMTVMEDLDG